MQVYEIVDDPLNRQFFPDAIGYGFSGKVTNEDGLIPHIKPWTYDTPGFMDITPDFEHLAKYYAEALSDHSFNAFALTPVISFVEIIYWLTLTNPDSVTELLADLTARAEKSGELKAKQAS
jgi:hypothetical protein